MRKDLQAFRRDIERPPPGEGMVDVEYWISDECVWGIVDIRWMVRSEGWRCRRPCLRNKQNMCLQNGDHLVAAKRKENNTVVSDVGQCSVVSVVASQAFNAFNVRY
jgi:hypothetical protein